MLLNKLEQQVSHKQAESETASNVSYENHRPEATQAHRQLNERFPAATTYKEEASLQFSSDEVDKHIRNSNEMQRIAADCLNEHRDEHLSFFKSHCKRGKCLSKFYGNRRFTARKGGKRGDGKVLTYLPDAVVKAGFPREWAEEMVSMSCVDLALRCLGRAFDQTGQAGVWKRVKRFTVLNGTGGTALQAALRKLGWKVHYWTPYSDTAGLKKWVDKEEKGRLMTGVAAGVRACPPNRKRPTIERDGQVWCPWESRGYHAYNFVRATRDGRYYLNAIDDASALVGFNKTTPRLIRDTTFWVGTSNGGYHVFPGTNENVVEAHSTRALTSIDNFEFSEFNPLATGGGPRWSSKEKYVSGMIAIPPK